MSGSLLRDFLDDHDLSHWSDTEGINALRSERAVFDHSTLSFFCWAINKECSAEQLREFIDLGANVNTQCRHNRWRIPLYVAVDRLNVEHVRILCEAGADINAAWSWDDRRLRTIIDEVWYFAMIDSTNLSHDRRSLDILEYMIVTKNISLHTRGAASVPEQLTQLLHKITARIQRCQRTCHFALLWLRKRMAPWVAKDVGERIARMVWSSRRLEIWDLK